MCSLNRIRLLTIRCACMHIWDYCLYLRISLIPFTVTISTLGLMRYILFFNWPRTIMLQEILQGIADNIGIKHVFSCINIRQVPLEVLKTEAEGRGFQHLPRDLANVNALKKHVRSLLLHKNGKHLLHFALFLALFCFAFSPMSRERDFYGLCSF